MYPSDLTDAQWAHLEPLLRQEGGLRHAGGRPRKHELRRVVDALLYVVKTGCQWRQLSANFPPWKAVHEQFRRCGMPDSGSAWAKHCAKKAAVAQGAMQCRPWPSSTHSRPRRLVKGGRAATTQARRSRGRKRHIAVDTQGNLLTAGRAFGRGTRSRRCPGRTDEAVPPLRSADQGLCRWRLHRHADQLGKRDVRLRCGSRQAQ